MRFSGYFFSVCLLVCFLVSQVSSYAEIGPDLMKLGHEQFEKREEAELRIALWVNKDPGKAKKRLLQEFKKAEDPEVSKRIFKLLQKAVLDEKFGPNKTFLGISMFPIVTGEEAFPAVLIEMVVPKSSADRAGLLKGDKIYKINGKPFIKSVDRENGPTKQLMDLIQSQTPGSELAFSIDRAGVLKEFNIRLGEMSLENRLKINNSRQIPSSSENLEDYFENWLTREFGW